MSKQSLMDTMLPPTPDGLSAHPTGDFCEQRARGPHGGLDFNYVGGQTGLNLTHPTVFSPVGGKVIRSDGGIVTIIDANGLFHEILHLDTQVPIGTIVNV